MTRVAMLSMHTSPLARLGVGDGGGMNVYIRELAERMTPGGVRVDVYTATETPQPDVVDLRTGLRVHHVPLAANANIKARTDQFTNAVAQQITRNGGADLLHAHYWTSGVVGHNLKHRLDLPLVSTFHTLSRVKSETGVAELDQERAAAEDSVIACSDAVIANDNAEAADLLRLYGADSDKVYVIPPGVDHSRFTPKNRLLARTMLGLPTNRPIVLFVGRIQPIKGADIAVATIARLRQTQPNALLVIVGGASGVDGEQTLSDMRARVKDEGLTDNVRFVGPQQRDTMVQWYSAANVVLMPSRSESFGLVALEASACGTPVVASAVGALPNVVTDGHSGYLVSTGDVDGYANAISRVLQNTSAAAELGAAGVKRAQSFNWDTTVNRTYCLYTKAMDAVMLAGVQAPCLSA